MIKFNIIVLAILFILTLSNKCFSGADQSKFKQMPNVSITDPSKLTGNSRKIGEFHIIDTYLDDIPVYIWPSEPIIYLVAKIDQITQKIIYSFTYKNPDKTNEEVLLEGLELCPIIVENNPYRRMFADLENICRFAAFDASLKEGELKITKGDLTITKDGETTNYQYNNTALGL